MTFRRALTKFKNSLLREFEWNLSDQVAFKPIVVLVCRI
mgnify:FL=1